MMMIDANILSENAAGKVEWIARVRLSISDSKS